MSRRQGLVLAVFRSGLVMTRGCGISSVAHVSAALQGKEFNTVRQGLREWGDDASDKRGRQRQAVAVRSRFSGLLKWM